MAAKGPRENIILECTECKRRNYMTSKNKRNNTDRLERALRTYRKSITRILTEPTKDSVLL